MATPRRHLYRGTTVDWGGNDVLQSIGCTPTTDDPLVATLFALDASRHGVGVVHICDLHAVASMIGSPNVLSQIEREVVIAVSPKEFLARFVVQSMPAQRARQILAEMGFELAIGFANKDVFRWALNGSPRLSDREVDRFDELAGWSV